MPYVILQNKFEIHQNIKNKNLTKYQKNMNTCYISIMHAHV